MEAAVEHDATGHTVVDRIKLWAGRDPHLPAFVFWRPTTSSRAQLCRGELLDLSSRFASRLTTHGVKPGDVVCISLPNCPERVVAEFGVQLAGAVSMNGQILRADGEDLIGSLQKAKCVAIILDQSTTYDSNRLCKDENFHAWRLCRKVLDKFHSKLYHADVESKQIPHLKTIFFCNRSFCSEILKEKSKVTYDDGHPLDVVTIFTTSGSTGCSKLVPRTHHALLTTAFFANKSMNLGPGKYYFNYAPLGWTGGYPLMYLFTGCTRVVLDESETGKCAQWQLPQTVWNILQWRSVDVVMLPPSVIPDVAEKKHDLRINTKLSNIFSRGQPLSLETLKAAQSLTDFVSIAYGSTETGLVSEHVIDAKNTNIFKEFTVGKVFEGINVKIVDNDIQELFPMSRGEILVRSPTLTSGYISGDGSENFLSDGWFRTGDVGYMREDGCLFVEGRSSDVIMHGSYILYPSWLEQKLVNCPGVKEVVIVPVPDKVLHHEICACVRVDETAAVKPSVEDIKTFCEKQILVDSSGSGMSVVPKYVLFLDSFPVTNTNKLSRRQLAMMAREKIVFDENTL